MGVKLTKGLARKIILYKVFVTLNLIASSEYKQILFIIYFRRDGERFASSVLTVYTNQQTN